MTLPAALFFDVDGVLVRGMHRNPALSQMWTATLEADLGVDASALIATLFKPDLWHEIVTGRRDLKDTLKDLLFFMNAPVTPEELVAYWYKKDSTLNAPLIKALRQLRKERPKLKLNIATTQEHGRAHYLWHDLGLSQTFDEMFYSAQLGADKREDAFFLKVQEQTGLNPAECLLIDDSPAVIETASRNGWQTFLADDYDQPLKILRLMFPPPSKADG